MNYRDYKNARDATWRLLIDCNVTSLPVKISEICKAIGIKVRLYTPADVNDGMSMIVDSEPVIFVSRNCIPSRQRFTAAHELGHVLLGHVGRYQLVNRQPTAGDNPVEQEANVFASRILAPACVLWGCGVKSAQDIEQLCDISRAAAEFRWTRMKALYRRNKFLLSPLEQQVFEQFTVYIRDHQLPGADR